MKLTMISHASVVIEEGSVSILSDPWFEGEAFNESWSLLCKPALNSSALKRVTHIWISHEHPDHLSFATLKAIPQEQRSRITLLYQRHMSSRVCQALSQLGFQTVLELPLGRWLTLGSEVSVLCYSIGSIDSLLAVRSKGVTILNVNDCIVTPNIVRKLRAQIGSVDVLLMQFSIAGWAGNPGDTDVAAREKVLDRMELCIRTLKPKITIPFASFVYFSHVKNRHMNAWVNTPDQVCQKLAGCPTQLQFLYNGDSWSSRDGFLLNDDPLHRYRRDFNRIPELPYRSHPSRALDELLALGSRLAGQVRASLPRILLRWVSPMHFYIRDLETAIQFDLRKGVVEVCRRLESECDLALSSQALWYSFKFPWGFSSLEVSGRYKLINPKASTLAMYLCHLSASDVLVKNFRRLIGNRRFWSFYWSKRVEVFDRIMSSVTKRPIIAHIPGARALRRGAGA